MDLDDQNAWTRYKALGASGCNLLDLLAVALSRNEGDIALAEAEAKKLVKQMPGARLADMAPVDLQNATGLESFESARILAAMEIGRRTAKLIATTDEPLTDPDAAYRIFADLGEQRSEHFCVAFLNSKAKLISRKTIHIGTLNMSVVGAREVFREAVRENAASIILAHNHPSGDPEPSPEDVRITGKLSRIGKELDIEVADHLIIGKNPPYVSLRSRGLMG